MQDDVLRLSLLAMLIGVMVGGAVILFREAIALIQSVAFGSGSPRLWFHAAQLPWWHRLLTPTLGGLLVGVWIHAMMPDRRPPTVADAIEASALKAGRMSFRAGLWGGVASALSIGCGASVGREGPAVHIGATVGSWLAQIFNLPRRSTQTLLGCGAAAAVAASFNAPIAGALFANEVVIGHYALKSFAPVVVSSVIGTIVSRAWFGDFPAFEVSVLPIRSAWEIPAFLGLGVLAGLTAILLMRGIRLAELGAARLPGPPWLRPAAAGALVGSIAVVLPQVLGIGYGVTEQALMGVMPLALLAAVCIAKIIATAISLGFGFAGGVFSPSLVIGAMLGGAYGTLLAELPIATSESGAYTIIGMGAVAAAVLGAPISTSLIVFEMTANYPLTIAVMLAVVVSTAVGRSLHRQSFFTWQLEQRGLDLLGGFQAALLRSIRVHEVVSPRCEVVSPDLGLSDLRIIVPQSLYGEVFVVGDNGELLGSITFADLSLAAFDRSLDGLVVAGDLVRRDRPVIASDESLETALRTIRSARRVLLAVVDDRESRRFAGVVHERDAMNAYTQALLEARRDERS
ncbi:MAG: chloride channel protein [Rhodospirillales bacterium]|nr:chloride channel protein [Rhodospirillales bacterium]